MSEEIAKLKVCCSCHIIEVRVQELGALLKNFEAGDIGVHDEVVNKQLVNFSDKVLSVEQKLHNLKQEHEDCRVDARNDFACIDKLKLEIPIYALCEVKDVQQNKKGGNDVEEKWLSQDQGLEFQVMKIQLDDVHLHILRWHAEERIDDGKLRHPADSQAWKSFDERNPIQKIKHNFFHHEIYFRLHFLTEVPMHIEKTSRNFEGIKGSNSESGHPIGKEEVIFLGDIEWIQAHRYVINSLSIVDDYKSLFNVDPEVNFVSKTEDDSYIQQPNPVDIVHNHTSWARADVEGVTLDPPSPKAKRSRRFGEVDPNDLSSIDEEIMYASDGSDAPSDDDDFFEQRNVANEDCEA
ncbi:OLC1v1005233C1 [Oldenlandia corymbosa var. corymbosa]|uniref:OLC1v1005233C1 n=1 Tax=Oldenlandia corymbosa var. corymbosa TaxID=529605 RepID=A0AAV1DH39_OLDCO|nr:OLC1v1005233C1 [Oldenlandia corymbosa var. corymbosa]